jgi:hypothetical protein
VCFCYSISCHFRYKNTDVITQKDLFFHTDGFSIQTSSQIRKLCTGASLYIEECRESGEKKKQQVKKHAISLMNFLLPAHSYTHTLKQKLIGRSGEKSSFSNFSILDHNSFSDLFFG